MHVSRPATCRDRGRVFQSRLVEMRTAAGPSSVVRWVLRWRPEHRSWHSRHVWTSASPRIRSKHRQPTSSDGRSFERTNRRIRFAMPDRWLRARNTIHTPVSTEANSTPTTADPARTEDIPNGVPEKRSGGTQGCGALNSTLHNAPIGIPPRKITGYRSSSNRRRCLTCGGVFGSVLNGASGRQSGITERTAVARSPRAGAARCRGG